MKPNIIIVMTDQQRASLRKSKGYPLDTMPFLDEWAGRGVEFQHAYTPNPTCMPARVSMFTGRYPSAHHVRTNHNAKDAVYTLDLLDVLKQAGYTTALFGKNHTHRKPSDFDYAYANSHLGAETGPALEEETQPQAAFDQFLKSTRFHYSATPAPGGVEVQYPYRNVTEALEYIDRRDPGTPFFAWISFAEPHNPSQVPYPYFDLFPPQSLPPLSTGTADLKAKGPRYVWMREIWERVMGSQCEETIDRIRSNYLGMLRLIDDQFKRLIEGLEQRGMMDNTLVLFVSDHGDFVGEYGLLRKGPDLSETLIRIPMIWGGAGVCAQSQGRTECVSLVDVLPTLCDMLGEPAPFGCQGRSLLPLLEGKTVPEGELDTAYCESGFGGLYWNEEDALDPVAEGATQDYTTFDCLNTWTQSGQVRAVREGNYKLQMDMMGNGYLYDLSADPLEVNNLWGQPQWLSIQAHMLARLAAACMRAADPIPAPRHRYRVKCHPQGYWFDPNYRSPDPGVRNE